MKSTATKKLIQFDWAIKNRVIIVNMHRSKMPLEQIAAVTELSLDEVKKYFHFLE